MTPILQQPPASTFTPSPEQEDFFSALRETSSNLLLKASAGSGKTTTIIHACRQLPAGSRVLFLAFNRDIADTLKARLPSSVSAQTFHSLGLAAWKKTLFPKQVKISGDKLFDILKTKLRDAKDRELYLSPALKLTSFAKNVGVGSLITDCPATFLSLIAHFDVQHEGLNARLADISQKLLHASNELRTIIDFDDMLYFPLKEETRLDPFDYVFIDEAQDTNQVQRELLARLLTPSSRLVAVGDASQAIYGFRGADASAMSQLKDHFSMTELPLSVSYRCSQAVVKEAQKWERQG